MSTFWSIWISVLTLIVIIGCTWILFANRRVTLRGEEASSDEIPKTGHVYDGIEEYDNPLPAWWFNGFLLTVIFAVLYLIWFPGFGAWKGVGDWTSVNQWEEEVAKAEAIYGPVFARYRDVPVAELAKNPEALKMGRRLFSNNCAVCHGSAARGSYGFPNLADSDWLYGGEPDTIKASITYGRQGAMPAWGEVIGEDGVVNVTEYVLSLSGRDHNADQATKGAEVFKATCVACHGADGKGQKALGAPDLTDDVWLYGASPMLIRHSVRNGRNGKMPAHQDLLKADKIHLLAGYVFSLTQAE